MKLVPVFAVSKRLRVAHPICFPTPYHDAQVRAELYKLSSLSLCSNTIGQLATGIMINPPKPGDPSFETFQKVGVNLVVFS